MLRTQKSYEGFEGNMNLLLSEEDKSDSGDQDEFEVGAKSREIESILKSAGYGLFHVILLLITGCSLAADSVEIFGVSFVVPIAEQDLNLRTVHKGYLDASIFAGMLIGGYLWGSLADVFGRKRILLIVLFLNGLCGLISAFSTNFFFFIIFRFASGIFVGGSLPIVPTYISEFFTEKLKGSFVIITTLFWPPGIIYTAFFAWTMLSNEGLHQEISFFIGSLHFVNWRLYLIICTFPAFLSSFFLLFMPESPGFLFQTGQKEVLIKVMELIHRVNSLCCCWCLKPSTDDLFPLVTNSLDNAEQDDASSDKCGSHTVNMSIEQLQPQLPSPPPTFSDSSLTYRFCIREKKMINFIYSKIKKICTTTVQLFQKKYLRPTILLIIIWFTTCSGYYGLQLWFPEYFKRLTYSNCNQNVTDDSNCSSATNLQFYQDTLYIATCSLPGSVVGAFLILIIGGRIQLVISLYLSALCVFSIWLVPSVHGAVLAVSCVFATTMMITFSSINVIQIQIYDVTSRSTAYGVHSGVGRVGAIFGNIIFGHFLDMSRAIPILSVASLLFIGAVASVFLPQIYRPGNRPLLVKWIVRILFRKS